MPILNGLETTSNIRLFDQATPIVACTANAQTEERANCGRVRMDGVLVKPITMKSLWNELSKHLKVVFQQTGPSSSSVA